MLFNYLSTQEKNDIYWIGFFSFILRQQFQGGLCAWRGWEQERILTHRGMYNQQHMHIEIGWSNNFFLGYKWKEAP